MKKKRDLKINIHLSNRWLYTFIVLGILISVGVGVYALTAGTAPNPGHLISEVAPPTGCSANKFLKFDGTNWVCADALNLPITPCSNGQFLQWTAGGWVCASPSMSLPTCSPTQSIKFDGAHWVCEDTPDIIASGCSDGEVQVRGGINGWHCDKLTTKGIIVYQDNRNNQLVTTPDCTKPKYRSCEGFSGLPDSGFCNSPSQVSSCTNPHYNNGAYCDIRTECIRSGVGCTDYTYYAACDGTCTSSSRVPTCPLNTARCGYDCYSYTIVGYLTSP